MPEPATPVAFASFLRDVSEATTSQQMTVPTQTKNGFAFWCSEAAALSGISSPFVENPDTATETVLTVARPGTEPHSPVSGIGSSIDDEVLAEYNAAHASWLQHRNLYDSLFAARTPGDTHELVFSTGLFAGDKEGKRYRRHLASAHAHVVGGDDGVLRVQLLDSPVLEINWVPGEARALLTAEPVLLDGLVEAQTLHELELAIGPVVGELGADPIVLDSHEDRVDQGQHGFGACPAILLRKRDSSATLQLMRDMVADMDSGGFVSEPFSMIVDPLFEPKLKETVNDRPALPLAANLEQREMIDRARSEAHMVIQGPPGTGKTHTIANLASVLMAEGRRVLITAENERALGEVQAKLPGSMQPLMLPMFRERGNTKLQRSVNELTTRAGQASSAAADQLKIADKTADLASIDEQLANLERRLTEISRADRQDHTFDGTTMRVDGHQQHLASKAAERQLIQRFLSEQGVARSEDAEIVLDLIDVVGESHERMRSFMFPPELMSASDFAGWLSNLRSQLQVLGDARDVDCSELTDRRDDFQTLATNVAGLPPTPWVEISRPEADYRSALESCREVASAVDHGVSVSSVAERKQVTEMLRAYLALDQDRFDRPLADLLEQHDAAASNASMASVKADFHDHSRAAELTALCEVGLRTLQSDRSGLLERHLIDHAAHGRSPVDALVAEAAELTEGTRAPVGVRVSVASGAPAEADLLRQAEALHVHLSTGGKWKGLIGTPAPVKQAAELMEHVRVAEAPICSTADTSRVIEVLAHRRNVTIVDGWAEDHQLTRPDGLEHHAWLTDIASLYEAVERVNNALAVVDELVHFPSDADSLTPAEKLSTSLATIASEILHSLEGLASAAKKTNGEVKVDGFAIANRAVATRAVCSLEASELREGFHAWLPESWRQTCDPLESVGDPLVRLLTVCADAASVPGQARRSTLSASSVTSIIEQADTDRQRNALLQERDQVLGDLLLKLRACTPMSPATQAVQAAVEAERTDDYRLALERLDEERELAEQASRLAQAKDAVASEHPNLVAELDVGEPEARTVLRSIDDLQKLRELDSLVTAWCDEIGSTEAVHNQMSELHRQKAKLEQEVASLRCWSQAVSRLTEKKELRSALSALTIAMDKVPKTRTAKSYPARMRALRQATKAAAPAIPCWVMPIDRVAEVLGYPKDADRFDVVIVDEASQAWFPTAFLYAIADQMIVVGDDLQTSPSQIVGETEIQTIAKEHIPHHRLSGQAGSDLSLYDVAAVMTGPDTMVDHFRCVPDIIDLSNRLSYGPKGKRLLPSRVREPGSLEPIKHVQVGGWRKSKSAANEVEVEAIVNQVAQCHADPKYDGMNFGVVVVGSDPNAHMKAIVTALHTKLGMRAFEERSIEVGKPAQFQGAERNVMFLSLVSTVEPGERLTRWPHEHTGRNRTRVQQLNVAVSRAQDQLWIFRSFDIEALAPDDARRVILDPPSAHDLVLDDELEKCDSQFERDVVCALAQADPNLAIRTQVEALGYSIDIVIEDDKGNRLAVECDGDRWHTSDSQIRSDLYRQRTLESIGWRFDRFLASEWYGEPHRRVEEILTALRAKRKEPTRSSRSTARPVKDSPKPPRGVVEEPQRLATAVKSDPKPKPAPVPKPAVAHGAVSKSDSPKATPPTAKPKSSSIANAEAKSKRKRSESPVDRRYVSVVYTPRPGMPESAGLYRWNEGGRAE